jgi:orotate phosphoribosyltransferase
MLTEEQVKELFIKTGAILEGHFLLTSGNHSPLYLEKFQVLQHPAYTARMGQALAELFQKDGVQLVVGPATGGILLAHEVGKNLNTRAIFTERENGKMVLKRGFAIEAGERVLIVEDIVTTGGSVKEVIDIVREQGGDIVGVGMLVDRSGGKADFGVPKKALLTLAVPTYTQDTCPLCKENVPLTKRGRTGK